MAASSKPWADSAQQGPRHIVVQQGIMVQGCACKGKLWVGARTCWAGWAAGAGCAVGACPARGTGGACMEVTTLPLYPETNLLRVPALATLEGLLLEDCTSR